MDTFKCEYCYGKNPAQFSSEEELVRHIYTDCRGYREKHELCSTVTNTKLVSDVTDQVTAQVNALLNKDDAPEIDIKSEPTDDYEMQAEPNEVTECIEAFLEEHRTIKDTGELLLSIYLQFDHKTYSTQLFLAVTKHIMIIEIEVD